MRELSFLNKGIHVSLTDKRKKVDGEFLNEEFHSEEGLKEFIKFLDENREPLIPEVISIEGEKNNVPVEIAMVYNSSFNENIHSYVNNINTHEGGTHLSGFRRGLTSTLKKYADSSGLLDKVKVEIAVAKGKKLYDKRQVKKTRDWNREKARILTKNNK